MSLQTHCVVMRFQQKLFLHCQTLLLKAHKLMMSGLVPENGRFRSGGVGVFDGEILIHMAPPAELVPEHIHNLFTWYQQSGLHPLIKSAILV